MLLHGPALYNSTRPLPPQHNITALELGRKSIVLLKVRLPTALLLALLRLPRHSGAAERSRLTSMAHVVRRAQNFCWPWRLAEPVKPAATPLQNQNGALPLQPAALKKVAVVGPFANVKEYLLG